MEEISVEDSFVQLADGRNRVTFDAVKDWFLVKELLDEKIIDIHELTSMFVKAGGKGMKKHGKDTMSLNFENFNNLLDLLGSKIPFWNYCVIFCFIVEPYAEGDDNGEHIDSPIIAPGFESSDESDRVLLENVFLNLANGKKYVNYKDLMDWDFVLDLFAEVFFIVMLNV
jgi:hypothetical protein